MGKHSEEKHINLKNIIFLFIILIVLIIFLYINFNNSSSNIIQENALSSTNNDSSSDSILSDFDSKTFEGAEHLQINNVRLSYENNITYIMFDLTNTSSNEQGVFDFSFSLLDENNITLTSYNVNSEETIGANYKKTFLLVSTMDLSSFVKNYSISLINN